jgi:hypothetical protein
MGSPKQKEGKTAFEGGGLVLFETVQDAMRAEKVLTEAGYGLRLVAPPPSLRIGCDLALEINIVEQPGIERALKDKGTPYMKVAPIKEGTSAILHMTQVTDFGKWTMVKAGNMKIAYEKVTGKIVNTSGGGCPDIPFLHVEMVDKTLSEAPKPKDMGYTLCARMLDIAYEKSLELWKEGK